MKTKHKKIIAREFLIVLSCLALGAIVYLMTLPYNYYISMEVEAMQPRINSIKNRLDSINSKVDSIELEKSIVSQKVRKFENYNDFVDKMELSVQGPKKENIGSEDDKTKGKTVDVTSNHLRAIYKKLRADGYVNMGSSYYNFEAKMSTPNNSRKVYDAIKKHPGIKGVPETYDDFVDKMGLSVQDPKSDSSYIKLNRRKNNLEK
ncbi:hypothetical protein [Salibacter sp.]|uniref:hypothetical protein n=1 Tax=Salibacter sp. TaxID=2010995 RepID=UPI0028703F3B|nr:hypothetical protein [Salibacter sp.]MDR9398904.1 hypothetical protein [Salibacter sp.]MDR9488552.1 hypothetical protein [Salibacter sp.]